MFRHIVVPSSGDDDCIAGAQSWMFGCSGRRSGRGMPFGSLLSPNFFDQPFTELKFGDKGERFASFGHFRSLRYSLHLVLLCWKLQSIHAGLM
ncbi:hypothetical protein [Paenibacillus polysaccharolyticus]|uniref:hypothetical protein n=1 Tax=Paenibacillus polysaccharolyticus TaxID=582692 RepID=UPI00280B017D|nr:hypothetical protein [Paenibacillus polysaccharolyticus]